MCEIMSKEFVGPQANAGSFFFRNSNTVTLHVARPTAASASTSRARQLTRYLLRSAYTAKTMSLEQVSGTNVMAAPNARLRAVSKRRAAPCLRSWSIDHRKVPLIRGRFAPTFAHECSLQELEAHALMLIWHRCRC